MSSSSSSKASSERGDDLKSLSMSSSPASSHSSSATTPEPSSPTVSAAKAADLVDPFQPRKDYNETVLPAIPASEALQPLATDSNTPDHWIPRDERMIRLTGKHPCNVEAPLSDLFAKGFLTPQNLFYVRSHGDTPRVTREQAENWKLKVHGLVENEIELSIKDLKEKFPRVTLPITLVCAGNRRKEQNMVAKGLGFNWGAAGVSTGLFTGVYLADILDYCKPKNPLLSSFPSYDVAVPGRARHVVFEGADELPKGKYGTSQRLNWALDRSKGMLIAWGLNGEDLSPDHGYPLRLVVPGQIGGRMVKWLERIEVSDRESQHHLHFHDNKVLPTEVTADQARSEMHWWYDPKYIINDLNVNAAICSPDHNQLLEVAESSSSSSPQMLPIEGYAYTGGGRRIHRVEISLDDGHSWKCASIHYPEDLYRMYPIQGHEYFGTLDLSATEMSFSWCFWRLDVDVQAEIIGKDVKVISVRALDEGLATMPRDMYWNATSMMNSWWFRVAVHREGEKGDKIRFEHPTLAGNAAGGWMQRMNETGLNPRYPQFGDAKAVEAKEDAGEVAAKVVKVDQKAIMIDSSKADTIVTAADLLAHGDGEGPEPWFVVHGHVYDGTGFLKDHPGGDQSIRLVAGEDATEDFMAIHSMDAKKMLRDYHLGRLETQDAPQAAATEAEVIDVSKPYLDPKKWRPTRLVCKQIISPDARIFRFALGSETQELGLPVGQHVFVRVRAKNAQTGEIETVQRAYTPYSGNDQRGFLDILIKVYFPSDGQSSPSFEGGKMTMLLEKIDTSSPSDDLSIELKGPLGSFTYLGQQQIRWKPNNAVRRVRKLAMIAGGSGITPIWSTLKAIADEALAAPDASSPDLDPMQIWVLYGNRTEQDILIREELERLRVALKGNLHVWHVLSKCAPESEASWTMGRGHITADCLKTHLPPPPAKPEKEDEWEDTMALVCGPPPMEKAVSEGLKQLGWDLERTVVFF
ncbi:nitrate reductase [Pseudozyma hubeiensis SY62]|uniref:Nitrate reductase [NADPH] n=1 Tax=Pseudozyma hubeiensis (strain SY62) TaxID=1305764 RepID=R9NX91_PSEHS|nr:nitrate reductase [Pseudozyma hubeiensis SY62]GAC93273.1 nitrate reductase [Pseudozyma hubeiensis SY62]